MHIRLATLAHLPPAALCAAALFDIADARKSSAENHIVIESTCAVLAELVTGQLLGPPIVYRERWKAGT